MVGCGGSTADWSNKVTYQSEYGSVAFDFPAGWKLNKNEHPFDLQCFSADEQLNFAAFVFYLTDLSEEDTPHSILLKQVEDMKSKRTGIKPIEDEVSSTTDRLKKTSLAFSGTKEPETYYYRFTLVEFLDDKTRFAVAYQIGFPDRMDADLKTFERITSSATAL